MRSTSIAYHFLLLLVGGVTFVTLTKIKKTDFYRHYFKVIAEVQSRNSHQLLELAGAISQILHHHITQLFYRIGWAGKSLKINALLYTPIYKWDNERCYLSTLVDGVHLARAP